MSLIRKIKIVIALVLLFHGYVFSLDVLPFQSRITLSQEEEIIAYPSDICVLEDECIVISDTKDQKIMLYNRNGQLLKTWKSLGQGPGEYEGMWWIDYCEPYLGVFDNRAQKLILYERSSLTDFQWIEDIHNKTGGNLQNFKLTSDKVIFDVPAFRKDRYYLIHIVDLKTKKGEYCLPAPVRYGKAPGNDFKKPDSEYRRLWGIPWSYIDVYNRYVYSAWEGMLNILRVNLDTKKWSRLGHKTKNYSQPKTWNVTRKERRKAAQWSKENKFKFSYIAGVFADENVVGVIYLNYSKKKSHFDPILQFYDGTGLFFREVRLEGSRDTHERLIHHYSRATGCLYILVMDELNVKFHIMKYKIRK